MQGPAIFDDFSTSPFAVGQAYQRGHSPRVSFSAQATHIPPPKPPPMNQVFTKATNTTRVLLLSGFATELKTRDLLGVFAEWEDQGDGFRVKWIDDQSAYIVFFDPAIAKKAFLATIANLPPSLAPSLSNPGAKLEPYTGPDVQEIVETAAKRPRSRSNAGHNRYGSTGSAYGGSVHHSISNGNMAASFMNGNADFNNGSLAVSGGGHGRSESLGARFAFPPPSNNNGGMHNGGPAGGPEFNTRHRRSGSTGSGSPSKSSEREAAARNMAAVLGRA